VVGHEVCQDVPHVTRVRRVGLEEETDTCNHGRVLGDC
jgi:hypothetical protein